jgi:putative transposase
MRSDRGIPATVYASKNTGRLMKAICCWCLIDEEYTKHPFYGSRRMVVFLKAAGHTVNRSGFNA